MAPHRYNVGDQVVITPECMECMRSHNRQAAHPGYPSDDYLAKIAKLVGVVGEVTHTFPPGYEVSVAFNGQAFHAKDNWIAPAAR